MWSTKLGMIIIVLVIFRKNIMNYQNILIVIILAMLSLICYLYNADSTEPIVKNSLIITQHEIFANIKNNEIKYDKKLSAKKLDNSLLYIARIISPASDQQLKDSWKDEYTCEDKVTSGCEKSIFNARSYEDALWLKRKGYLTRSMLELLTDISKRDLHELSKHGNLNAKNLLAINALNDNDLKNARRYAISSTAFSTGTGSRETFGYLILAQSYIEDKQPMMGALYLRIASLLGDTNAADQYQQLTAQTAATVIDDINLRAFSVLLTALNTHISNWDNDPRPRG